MIDTEEKQILDKANKDRDLEELQHAIEIDGHVGPLQQAVIDQFYTVTASMKSRFDQVPDLPMMGKLDTPEFYAIKALHMARLGRDLETGGQISGLERMDLLNQALIYLQPVLALGLRPDFREGRVIYDQLVAQISEVRTDIKSAIKVQTNIPAPERSRDKVEDQDADDDPRDGDTGDTGDTDDTDTGDNADRDAADGDAGQRASKPSLWQRLTGRKSTSSESDDEG